MKKILFVIPTLFYNKDLVSVCIESLVNNLKKFNIDYKICLVINEDTDEFQNYKFNHDIVKLSSNLQFSISKALNTGAQYDYDYDYFCYVDDGMEITNEIWIDYLIDLFNQNSNLGLVGARPHSTYNYYHNKINDYPELYNVLWSDGILFTTKNHLLKYNGFDESYFGDCELQDFGYKLHFDGFVNLYWKNFSKHNLVDFTQKSSKPSELITLVNQSRELFKSRWNELEYKYYGFMTNFS